MQNPKVSIRSAWLRIAQTALIALAVGCASKPADSSDSDAAAGPASVEVSAVATRSIATVVVAQGVISAAQGSSAKVGAISAGRIASVFVKEGDSVSAGQLVALLENKTQSSQSQSALAALAVSRAQAEESALNAKSAQLDQAAGVKIAAIVLEAAKVERESALKQAVFDVKTAQLELTKAARGNRPQEVAQAQQAELQAQVAKDAAEREEKRDAYLLSKGIVSQKAYDDSKAAWQNSIASLNSAQSQLSLMREGPRPEDKQAARLKVDAAIQALNSTKVIQEEKVQQAIIALRQAQQGELQVQVKRQEAEANARLVAQRVADTSAARAAEAQLEVRAPIAGRVVRRLLNPGDTPDNNSPILEIVSPKGGLDLVAGLPVANGSEIAVGMRAVVSVAERVGVAIEGEVKSIGQVDPASGLLALRVHIPSPPQWLRPGTFATTTITIKEHRNAIAVPTPALLTRDGASIVFVAKGDKAVLTKVEVGSEQDGFTEIREGLQVGQSVVTLGNYELSDGAAIKTAEPDDKADVGDKSKADEKGDAGSSKPPGDKAESADNKKGDQPSAGTVAK